MDHTTHLRKKFQLDKHISSKLCYHNIDDERKNINSFLRIECTLFVVPFIQACFMRSLVEIGQTVLGEKILTFRQCIFAISLLSPLGNRRGHSY